MHLTFPFLNVSLSSRCPISQISLCPLIYQAQLVHCLQRKQVLHLTGLKWISFKIHRGPPCPSTARFGEPVFAELTPTSQPSCLGLSIWAFLGKTCAGNEKGREQVLRQVRQTEPPGLIHTRLSDI